MELPIRVIITVAIALLVVAVILSFLFSGTAEPLDRSEANRVFSQSCLQYKERQCEWSVTREEGFTDFLDACKYIYGQAKDSFSCLYVHCEACKEFSDDPQELMCAGLCEEARASERLGISTVNVCQQIRTECTSTQETCDDVCGV